MVFGTSSRPFARRASFLQPRSLLLAFLALSALAAAGSATAATYYVRTDGGSAAQCTGTNNAAYPGSGSNQACAWNSLHQALPIGATARINGGDTVYIAPGEYMIGWGAPGAEGGRCYSGGRYDCYLPPIPSGPSATSKTRILGLDPARPPKLWGTERVQSMLNLNGSSNVEIGHLEITDKSDCVEFHTNSSARCERNSAPYGQWASVGISASNSRNVHLHDLDIHGLANRGIMAGGLTDWTVERVKFVGNGWAGWDGDIGSGSSNSGNIVLREVEIGWNGCGERWQTRQPWACWAQQAGGYGDGLGTATTGGHWLIEDSYIHHNTSDGIDLLYMDGGSNSSVTIRRTHAVGNAGNQLKTNGRATIENSVVIGNCSFFDGRDSMQSGDQCRALGNVVSVGMVNSQPVVLRHNTITGEGDCLILSSGGGSSASLSIQNNALVGQTDWRQPFELSCGHYADNSSAQVSFSGNAFWNVKQGQCPSGSICTNPRLASTTLASFDATPLSDSPLVNKAPALSGITNDFYTNPRPSGSAPDIGAIELQSGGGSPTPTCTRNAPTLSLSGGGSAVAAGTAITYTLSLTNRDSSACQNTSFSLARTVPSGWTGTLGSSSLSVAPGASASTTLRVTSPTSASAGSYNIGAGTSSSVGSSHTANASATYTVASQTAPPAPGCTRAKPTVRLTGSSRPSRAGNPARYTLSITNRDSGACGSTTFNLARTVPSGWTGTLDASSLRLAAGASGSTTLRVNSQRTTSAGSYDISARTTSSVGSVHSASAVASHTVASVRLYSSSDDKSGSDGVSGAFWGGFDNRRLIRLASVDGPQQLFDHSGHFSATDTRHYGSARQAADSSWYVATTSSARRVAPITDSIAMLDEEDENERAEGTRSNASNRPATAAPVTVSAPQSTAAPVAPSRRTGTHAKTPITWQIISSVRHYTLDASDDMGDSRAAGQVAYAAVQTQ
ncbi:NEW3 domain-containing protein [Marilutibacter alkalisoli]|uniref:NEW3 domain-containing protein n=1 Tax=Marilutibacter alkalisoli TaxID=2591633 RepID=UPI0014228460|nr:NEW3 domain-containing protein [Lysobacter alkalisoli]